MLRGALALVALGTAAWAAVVAVTGGAVISVAGLRISSTGALRPAILAAAAAIGYFLLGGKAAFHDDFARVRSRLTASRAAVALAAAVTLAGIAGNPMTAGGADSFAYVTQADLLRRGAVAVEIPMAAAAPWPNALATMVPAGYRAVSGRSAAAPITGPGLPALMAAFKTAAGHCAMFLPLALAGGLLVWATFVIGRRLGSPAIGLGAAWIVAASPTFLMMTRATMSDVPAAAAIAVAVACALVPTTVMRFAAGLAAGAAVLFRPNLLPLAGVIGIWIVAPRALLHGAAYAAGPLVATSTIALLNRELWGSPFTSGYGDASALFSPAFISDNLARYGGWLIDTQTPLAVAGLVALFIPWRRLWPTSESRRGALLLGLVALGTWALYLVYVPFDAWWFLRFLLPSWPAIGVGTSALILRLFPGTGNAWRFAAAAVIIVIGVAGMDATKRREVFPDGEGERRYATIALLIDRAIGSDAVVFTGSHAGPVRYYAGRETVRFDLLDASWLDRALAWVQEQGRRPYILIEDWERPAFERRFAATNRAGALSQAPVLAYASPGIPGTVFLYDPFATGETTVQPSTPQESGCIAPKGFVC